MISPSYCAVSDRYIISSKVQAILRVLTSLGKIAISLYDK